MDTADSRGRLNVVDREKTVERDNQVDNVGHYCQEDSCMSSMVQSHMGDILDKNNEAVHGREAPNWPYRRSYLLAAAAIDIHHRRRDVESHHRDGPLEKSVFLFGLVDFGGMETCSC
jgi:hypothetical protein